MISKEDVLNIASLSRIHLKDNEIDQLTKNLEDILEYITKLENLDVSNVEPTSHVLALENVYREDTVIPSLGQANAIKISADIQNGSFKVPKVIE
ncbi:MAG: Asp-tRNA(Asn)/Glu-tRNA(Gln) amidotransferase subunit GatC [Candidatus Omnitrophica bacterium]|nr:Asp-tRNA(Asn)/Glu-tRNA(Gln) amidotransferase subunit GatC [Candidatus Omnitrophota bacterium]MBU1996335.1 Asp-tRNA(Asn)/Glu-tRNA(Gln) amidotransferase subunit GatC [Candidatus Omnitrophota bacterium]MBU4333740.1 Asp-tRNA(Asn)/Glu-tRNA(Gln) amidotransferase subunit GatC [Candidatus Omnitrophota bacterium]